MRSLPLLSLVVVALCPALLSARTLVEAGRGTVWKYLDTDVAPAANWRAVDFDDSKWKSGSAPLGFGEPNLTTEVNGGPDKTHRPLTTWFRREFDQPQLKPGEALVVLCCVDDGAVVYLNGEEIGRINMPRGPVDGRSPALKTVGNDEEGLYQRIHIPTERLRLAKKNVLAVEVHQAGAGSSDLYFDLALKVMPAALPYTEVAENARPVIETFNKRHYLGDGVTVPDGYIDGGRGMKIGAVGDPTSGREILVVDRSQDAELKDDLAYARSAELKALPTLERVQRLAARIDAKTTPPGGLRWVGESTKQLENEFENEPVLIGDWVDQCQAGVCRHRALLFKVLADEAGLRTALVRGNFARKGPPGIAHAWNEVVLDDGRRVLVDVMHNGGKPKFPPLNDPEVVQRYLKVDDTPWYSTTAD